MSAGPHGFTTEVAGRVVTVRAGMKSQTINVCTSRQVVGDYEAVYRLPIESAIEGVGDLPAMATLAEFDQWLIERNAVAEGSSAARGATSRRAPLVPVPDGDEWVSAVVPLVEQAIGRLTDSFVKDPYLHRVEHSLHADLIAELRTYEPLQRRVGIGRSGWATQLIHKEWPEMTPRVDRGKTIERRGLFDVVVLAPSQLGQANLEQFRQGRIAPPIVIEIGLDYGLAHLDGDVDKFVTSKVPHPYLLQFSRIQGRLRSPRCRQHRTEATDRSHGDRATIRVSKRS
jgi:hypothetical protein